MPSSALVYLNKKFSVIPAGRDKRPLLSSWAEFQKRRPSETEIAQWREKHPNANIALVCGRISDLTAVDCDTAEAVKTVDALLPDSLEVPTSTTPRGGRHYYFRFRAGLISRNGTGSGIDVKSEGGYVLVPPSKTDKGSYVAGPFDIDKRPAMPEALLAFLKKGQASPVPNGQAPPLTQGRRDDDLFHMALQLFKDGHLREEVERVVLAAARAANPPFPEHEARAKVKSAYERFSRQRQGTGERAFLVLKRKFSECDPEPVRWMMKDKIPLGMLTVFLGNPGEGKTFLAVEIASRLSKGEPLPGYSQALVNGSTVFVSAENALNYILVPRAIACGADRSKLIHMPTVKNDLEEIFVFDVTRHIPALEKEILENPDIRLVIVDPIVSHLGNDTDSFNQVQIRRALDGLSLLAEKTGVAIIVIMHMNKSQTTDVIFRASGSVQFMAAAKAAFLIAKDSYDPSEVRRLFMPVKSNLSADRSSLAFKIEPYTIFHEDKTIEVGRVVFEQTSIQVDVADIMNPENRHEKTIVGQAIGFLNDALKYGPLSVVELERKAAELGIGKPVLKKARTKRGIVAEKQSMTGGWLCYLPEHYKDGIPE
jgi:putative DNA primase/helicase